MDSGDEQDEDEEEKREIGIDEDYEKEEEDCRSSGAQEYTGLSGIESCENFILLNPI